MLVVTIVLSISVYVNDYEKSSEEIHSVKRKDYGEGSITEEFEITVDGKKQKDSVEIEVSERQYTEAELKDLFKQAIPVLEKAMLGENKSMDEVREDLELLESISGMPIIIKWEIDRYDVVNYLGQINQENVAENGTVVELKAYLQYSQDETRQMLHVMNIKVYPKTGLQEQLGDLITKAIETEDASSISEEYLQMPSEVEGQEVIYHRPMDDRSFLILGFGAVIAVLLWCLEGQEAKEKEVKKEEQMMRDYPEIIGKLNLLLGAGITVKSAWKKILTDYEKQKSVYGPRYAYEEMANTYREMQSGVTEAECYEHFGRNCRLKSYRKLGTLLSQNLRKGTRGLTELLNLEAIQAYEERKLRAKRLGEEAGTKLLMPMFLMLAVVLVVVIVPAFMAIQI